MRTRLRRAALVVGVLLALSTAGGCSLTAGQQFQVDPVASGYHVHLYRTTTMWVWVIHSTRCGWDPTCTLDRLRAHATSSGAAGILGGVDSFFDDDVADFDDALRSTPHPWPLSVNLPEQYGCLGGYKNLLWPRSDGDWYGDPPSAPWCQMGQVVR